MTGISRIASFFMAIILPVSIFSSFSVAAPGDDISGELVIVTPYPEKAVAKFTALFKEKYPLVTIRPVFKKTTAGIKMIQQSTGANRPDIFWASAPDAFEVLKADGLLAKADINVDGIPALIGTYPVNDVDGFYSGFAASGYGIMWNTEYLAAHQLPAPKNWADLAKPVYFGHVGISAPSRSGTTHLTVEAVLQGLGWERGWALWKAVGGNLKAVTKKSRGVPKGVMAGKFGAGIVIDYYGFTAKAGGKPIGFTYPKITTMVPANIAVVKNGPNQAAATAFISFLLSRSAQEVLFDPVIGRLPLSPAVYQTAPKGYPNPHKDKTIGAAVRFDLALSKSRYGVVNSLFDSMITFVLPELRATIKTLHTARVALSKSTKGKHLKDYSKEQKSARQLIFDAEELIFAMPIDAATASKPTFNQIFKIRRKSSGTKVTGKQHEIETRWETQIKRDYAAAQKLATKALTLISK